VGLDESLRVVNRKLFFITPALSGGGIELSTPILLRNLRNLVSHELHWIGVNHSTLIDSIEDVKVVSMERCSGDGLRKTLKILLRLRNIITKEADSIVVVNGEMAELLAFFLPKHVEIVCVEHASNPWSMNRFLGFLVRKRLSMRASAWVTVNTKQETIWPGIKDFRVICNPVEITAVHPGDQKVGLIHIGRVTADKGVATICSVAELGGFRLDVYGDGDLRLDLLAEYAQNPNIKFHGYVEKVWEQIGQRRLFISASLHEGDGRNIAEAIVRRQPILLLDTIDNRRFELPDSHYFSDSDSLLTKIKLSIGDGFMSLRPPVELSKWEAERRDPWTLAISWNSLISSIEKGNT